MARRIFVFIVRMAVLASAKERRKWSDQVSDGHCPAAARCLDPDLVPPPGPKQSAPYGRPWRHSGSPGVGVAAPHDRVFFSPAIGVVEANCGA
jgi:hypothetical protein